MAFNQIKQRVKNTAILNSAILSPLSEEHEWQNVEIVTLKQATIDKATDYVLSNVQVLSDVNAQVQNQLQTAEYRIGREFVDINENNITISIHCDKIDDHIVDKAISRLMDMDKIKLGVTQYGPEHIMNFDSCNDSVDVV